MAVGGEIKLWRIYAIICQSERNRRLIANLSTPDTSLYYQ